MALDIEPTTNQYNFIWLRFFVFSSRLLIPEIVRDGHKWVYKACEIWKTEEFGFWSVAMIKRAIRRLEKQGLIIMTSDYNQIKDEQDKMIPNRL